MRMAKRTKHRKKRLHKLLIAFAALYLFLAIVAASGANTSTVYILTAAAIVASFEWVKAYRKRTSWRGKSLAEVDCMNGWEFEHFLAPVFEQHGYKATVTQGSGDYGADLILERKGKRYAVQAKCECETSSIGIKAVQQVVGSLRYYNATKGFVVTNRFYTKAAKELARVNGITLIDRDALEGLITKRRQI